MIPNGVLILEDGLIKTSNQEMKTIADGSASLKSCLKQFQSVRQGVPADKEVQGQNLLQYLLSNEQNDSAVFKNQINKRYL
jgi:hypothetical protein